ncbi:MAG: hypothetical protein U9N02_03515 [Campylobacterota bacterium]|nr:hypothetical protein [Campylobacterota bacterium]
MYAYLGSGLDFELGDTSGYYYEIPVKYDINNKYSIEISYKYDYWKISKSNIVNGYYEPNSKTKNKIIKIGMIYKW